VVTALPEAACAGLKSGQDMPLEEISVTELETLCNAAEELNRRLRTVVEEEEQTIVEEGPQFLNIRKYELIEIQKAKRQAEAVFQTLSDLLGR